MQPFVGWFMVVEEAQGSTSPVRDSSVHFSVDKVFQNASYLKRYDVLCQRLVKEKLYTAASVISTPRSAIDTGAYAELSALTGLSVFVRSLAMHIAAEASR